MAKQFTHQGKVENYNYGSPYQYSIKLYETKLHWVTENGVKWRKSNGKMVGSDSWSQTRLLINTIQCISA